MRRFNKGFSVTEMVIVSALLVPCMAVAYLAIWGLTRSMSEDCRDAGNLRGATEMAVSFRLDAAQATIANVSPTHNSITLSTPGGTVVYGLNPQGRIERVAPDLSIQAGPSVRKAIYKIDRASNGGALIRAVWTNWRTEDPRRNGGEPWTLVLDTAARSLEERR